MNLSPSDFAAQVWQETRPHLLLRRLKRRALGSGAAALLLAALTITLWPGDAPAEYQWISHYGTPEPEQFAPSLAVLVVDQFGAHFQELRPEDLTAQGLQLDLSIEPVITSSLDPYH